MRGPLWVRAAGLGVAGASAHALAGWWAVALVVGLFWVQMGFYWEARHRLERARRTTSVIAAAPTGRQAAVGQACASGDHVWDGTRWNER